MLKKKLDQPVGVIGSGSFGTTVAKLLSYNNDVLIFSRQEAIIQQINESHLYNQVKLAKNIRATNSLEEVGQMCSLIFPVVPSASFRRMMTAFSPFLKPYHILIHGTKGFDLTGVDENQLTADNISRDNLRTVSEVILDESSVVRVGCLSGPNLSSEILAGQPTAAVIASKYDEVIHTGERALDSPQFAVFGSYDIIGAELAGALKNIIALGSGILGGMGLGKNIQAMLITRGLREMIKIGKALGAESRSFLGTAGIGDLIATATSPSSRNYAFGSRLAKGETLEQIQGTLTEVAEGVRTLRIVYFLAKHHHVNLPIIQMLYYVVYEGFETKRAMEYLMRYPYSADVDFL